MSTNYYFRPSPAWKAFDNLHIGKYACRSFGFHGIRLEGGEQSVEVGSGTYIKVNVPRLMLTTSREWEAFLLKSALYGGYIYDEYGSRFFVHDFVKKCWDKPSPERQREFMSDKWGRKDDRWIDPDGYCFSGYEFS